METRQQKRAAIRAATSEYAAAQKLNARAAKRHPDPLPEFLAKMTPAAQEKARKTVQAARRKFIASKAPQSRTGYIPQTTTGKTYPHSSTRQDSRAHI